MRTNHNATVAKIMAMYGKRITGADYSELMTRQNVSDIAEYLKKNTHFADTLASIDTSTIHRGMLEDLLRRHLYETYMKVTKFENLQQHEFYNFKLIHEEIDEILSCIQHLNAKSENQISGMPIYLNQYLCYDLIELAKVRSFDELLELIKHTPYYELLKKFQPDENGRVDYTVCEVKLRTYYLDRILKSVKELSPKSRDALKMLITTDVDLINIINAYRLNAFFSENADTIEKNALPFYGRISKAKEHEIFSAQDSEEFLKRYAKTYYGRQMTEMGNDLKNLEIGTGRLRYKYIKLALKSATSASVSVYSYIYLMNVELHNLITIIEGVRYGVSVKAIEDMLII